MKAKCIAYNEEGFICGKAATILDKQRGGMVCSEHAPKENDEKSRADEKK